MLPFGALPMIRIVVFNCLLYIEHQSGCKWKCSEIFGEITGMNNVAF